MIKFFLKWLAKFWAPDPVDDGPVPPMTGIVMFGGGYVPAPPVDDVTAAEARADFEERKRLDAISPWRRP